MGINIGRDGPGTKEEGPRLPAKVSATPDQRGDCTPIGLISMILNPMPNGKWAGVLESTPLSPTWSHQPSSRLRLFRMTVAGFHLDDNRRIRLALVPQPDGGRRSAWVRQHLFSSPDPYPENRMMVVMTHEPFAGTGVPMRPLHPAGSGAVSVLA